MKSFLALVLFVGIALGSGSTGYFGWAPHKEMVFRFETEVISGVPELRRDQYSGVKLSSKVLVQTKNDYTLALQFVEPKFIVVNGELPMREGRPMVPAPEREIPEPLRRYLNQPFLAHLKRGVVERFFVEEDEPVVVTNIKKSLLSQLQMDLTGARRGDLVHSNTIPTGGDKEILEGGFEGKTFFSTEESSLNGDCQKDYNMYPMPKYQSQSLEAQWQEEERELRQANILRGEKSEGKEVCEGKQYWTIVKTDNFDNCRQRPVYVSRKGVKVACDPAKAECKDLYTVASTTKYVVCGTPESFIIREVVAENTGIFNPLAINTEKTITSARVTLFLLKVKGSGSFTPLNLSGMNKKEKTSLIMEYPLENEYSSKSSIKPGSGSGSSPSAGIFEPVRQMPGLHTPDYIYPSSLSPSKIQGEIIGQIEHIVGKIGGSFTSGGSASETCGMNSEFAGKISGIVSQMRYLNYEQLRSLESQLKSTLGSFGELKKALGIQLFHDLLSMTGTNPAVVLMKEKIVSGTIPKKQRVQLIQTLIRDVRTPTKQILGELVQMVKTLKGNGPSTVYYTALNQLSSLFYKACVDTSSSISNYPVRIYGEFCSKDSSVLVEEYIPYLTGELERIESRGQRMAMLSALGKTGHKKALIPLTKAIEGKFSTKPMIRSLAVYSLRRIAKQEPTLVKPVVLQLIDNLAENTEVRIAAVSVLPYCQPSVAELQKIAIRSWFEPSKQVTSFIYSTLKGLTETQVPELKPVGLKCRQVLSLVKPFQYGIQFSHNTHFGNFINSLRVGGAVKASTVKTAEDLLPSRSEFSTNLYGAGIWEFQGLDFTLYSRGMDAMIEKVISYLDGHELSSSVESELRTIKEKLNIKTRGNLFTQESPEIFAQLKAFGLEGMYHTQMDQVIEELASIIKGESGYGSENIFFVFRTLTAVESEVLMPTISGFPLYQHLVAPVVFGAKKSGESPVPTFGGITLKAIPTTNMMILSNVGVICPITKEFVGTGVELNVHLGLPVEVKAKMDSRMEVTITLKTPEEIRGDVELVHTKVYPYTVVKKLVHSGSLNQNSDVKVILTGKPTTKVTYPLNKALPGLSGVFEVSTDYKVYDLAYIYNTVKEQGIAGCGLIPQTLKHFNLRIVSNPSESEITEVQFKFNLLSGISTPTGIKIEKLLTKVGLGGGISSGIYGMESGFHGISESEYGTSLKKEVYGICKEHYSGEYEIERCVEKHTIVGEIAEAKEETEEICGQIHFGEQEKKLCKKGVSVCHKAKIICEESGVESGKCTGKARGCFGLKKAAVRMIHLVKKMEQQQEEQQIGGSLEKGEGYLGGLSIEASLKGKYGPKKSVSIVLVGGATQKGRIVQTESELIIGKSGMSLPPYEIALRTTTRLPEVLYRWNLHALLEQSIEMDFDAQLYFGRAGHSKTKMALRSTWMKSQKHIESVRASPEYRRCQEEERMSRPMSAVCEETRHQAGSVDVISAGVFFPKMTGELSPFFTKVVNGLKYLIISNVELTGEHVPAYTIGKAIRSRGQTYSTGSESIMFDAHFNRLGNAFTVDVMTSSSSSGSAGERTFKLKNIRVPGPVRGFMPLSLRNGVSTRIVQKITRDQAPASCTVDHSFVSTFDNRTYGYELNGCEHLLFKDCSGLRPVAVTAAKEGGNTKKVKVLLGSHKVEMKQASNFGGSVEILIDGYPEHIQPNEEYTRKSSVTGKTVLKIYRNKDGVVSVENPIEKVKVYFDNKRIEIVAPQLFHNVACGLCGDLNLENTADLKSPEECLFSKDKFAAYSYMMKEGPSCSGIPSQDKGLYQHELSECVKLQTVVTPVTKLAKTLVENKPKATSVKHLVHKEANRICFSQKLQKVCGLNGGTGRSAEVTMPFTCFTYPSTKGEQLLKRAEAGEVLSTVLSKPTMYSKKVVVTLTCGDEPFQPIGGETQGVENYRTGARNGLF